VRDVTLLWALRSPCNLGCRYCYFGTIEEHRTAMPSHPGELSHLSRNDLSYGEITAFLSTIGESAVHRVFIAGGEPLIWPHTLTIVEQLKAAGVEVIVCTNGIPLNRVDVAAGIVELGVDAVSVSLDSTSAERNDLYRPSRSGVVGWRQVVSGIETLLSLRGTDASPRVGLYTVITRTNIECILQVARLAANLGADYYVPQPISLSNDHALYGELELRVQDESELVDVLNELYLTELPLDLPEQGYANRFVATVTGSELAKVRDCFGGHTLFFIEPDGSVWDCPSRYRIRATPGERRRNIRDHCAAEMFDIACRTCPADCRLFSRDCVNMWPLMDFTRFLRGADGPGSRHR
jgi:MoaA/NifB/PqqE/SkfB family radical SAM enzyme